MPSHTAIRDWILQVGYYKLTSIQKSNDWVGMIDLSIQIGSKKCLLILGVQVVTLLKSKALTFEDVHVLHLELLEKTSGPIIYEVLKKSEKTVGQYRQFCHDQGSDIVSATRLYAQGIYEAEGRKIPIMNDIAHKIANLLAVEVAELGWAEFALKASQMKQKLQWTKWAALCPPSQRSKARYMNLDELTGWANKMLDHLKKMEHEHQKKIEQKSCVEKSEVELRELLEQFGWVRSSEAMIREVSEMLLIGRIVRQKIRTEHLHHKTAEELEQELQNLQVGVRADQFAGSLLDFVTDQAKDLDQVALGSTEIIESSFGKLKQLMDEDSKDGFTPFVLSLAACLGKLDLDTVQAALRTCNKKQVKEWATTNIGETIYSQRRRIFNPFKRQKRKREKLPQSDGGLHHTGFFSGNVVNF